MAAITSRAGGRAGFALAVVATVLLALNLRIPTTALGPLLPTMQSDTGHGETFLSLLTAIPLGLTLLVAPVAPHIAVRFGRDRVIGAALVAIVAGILVRSIAGDATLLAGTAVLGAAIAFGTVLAPATIAAAPPNRRASLTGSYTMALSLGPALALAFTVPMMNGTGLAWRGTLMLWSACAVLALAVWIAHTWNAHSRITLGETTLGETALGKEVLDKAVLDKAVPGKPVIRDRRVWELAVYLGITSLTFYTTSTWLPTAFVEVGLDAGGAGGLTSLVNVVAIPFALLAPIGMRRGMAHILAPLGPLLAAVGVAVLLIAGSGGVLAVAVLVGISQGACLGVAYGQIVEYAASPEHAASVSAVTSAIGIALAALGPLAFGFGLEASGSYVVPMVGLAVVILLQGAVGLRTGRPPAALGE